MFTLRLLLQFVLLYSCAPVVAEQFLSTEPERTLNAALTAWRQGQGAVFVQKVRDALKYEWRPSPFVASGPSAQVKPHSDLGNVSFSAFREVVRTLTTYIQSQKQLQKEDVRLCADLLHKLSVSKPPPTYVAGQFFAIRGAWHYIGPVLKRLAQEKADASLAMLIEETERLFEEQSRFLRRHSQKHPDNIQGEAKAEYVSGLDAFAKRELPRWQAALGRLSLSLSDSAGGG